MQNWSAETKSAKNGAIPRVVWNRKNGTERENDAKRAESALKMERFEGRKLINIIGEKEPRAKRRAATKSQKRHRQMSWRPMHHAVHGGAGQRVAGDAAGRTGAKRGRSCRIGPAPFDYAQGKRDALRLRSGQAGATLRGESREGPARGGGPCTMRCMAEQAGALRLTRRGGLTPAYAKASAGEQGRPRRVGTQKARILVGCWHGQTKGCPYKEDATTFPACFQLEKFLPGRGRRWREVFRERPRENTAGAMRTQPLRPCRRFRPAPASQERSDGPP